MNPVMTAMEALWRPKTTWVALAACMLLAQCKSGPPPAPGDQSYHGRANAAYRNGYHHGFMDGTKKLEPNFERYHNEYTPSARELFGRAYQAGYEAGRHNAPASSGDEDRAFQNGRDAGQSDALNGVRPDPSRYRSQYSTGSEGAFRDGYAAGFEEGRKE